MKIKLGLKHYEVIKIENIKEKISSTKINDKILYYPNTNTITTYFKKNNSTILVTNLDYQVEKIFRDVPKNKIIHIKKDKKKIHMFLIPSQTKDKIVIGSVLKLIN